MTNDADLLKRDGTPVAGSLTVAALPAPHAPRTHPAPCTLYTAPCTATFAVCSPMMIHTKTRYLSTDGPVGRARVESLLLTGSCQTHLDAHRAAPQPLLLTPSCFGPQAAPPTCSSCRLARRRHRPTRPAGTLCLHPRPSHPPPTTPTLPTPASPPFPSAPSAMTKWIGFTATILPRAPRAARERNVRGLRLMMPS